jgi:Ca2+-binding RTX toxin-like protein
MADLTVLTDAAFDTRFISVFNIVQGILTISPTFFSFDHGQGNLDRFEGFGLSYFSDGALAGGTVTGFSQTRGGVVTATLTGGSASATALQTAVDQNRPGGELVGMFLAGNDQIHLGGGNDYISGGGGNDAIFGGPGNDVLDGGFGDDFIDGGPGNDSLSDLVGKDTLVGGAGDDFIQASFGNSLLDGGDGNDTLNGGPGNDTLLGGNGNDTLYISQSSNDVLDGGPGDDLFASNGFDGAMITFVGGDGVDTVSGFVSGFSLRNYEFRVTSQGWFVQDVFFGSGGGLDLQGIELVDLGVGQVLDLRLSDPAVAAEVQRVLRAPRPDLTMIYSNHLDRTLVQLDDLAFQALPKAAKATTSVATISYQFFTGRTPSSAGLDFLVSSTGPNPNNLNSAYYQSFNIENRYINFAVNLGKLGEGAAAFQAAYGSLDLFAATKKAYEVIFGVAPSDQKVHDLLDPVLQLGGVSLTRAQYFAVYGSDGPNGQGTKAAMVGFLLTEAVKADLGVYAIANHRYLAALADHATYNVDIVGVYHLPGDEYRGG